MCGIAGFCDRNDFDRGEGQSLVRQMCTVIRHRGPDDEGIHVADGIAMGMRRLSIIDLATGHQPIHNEDRSVWTVFNGEIYNFSELRLELEAAGHRFYTSTDTEVIVHAYEEWGTSCIARFRGMFGLAIWDARNDTLLIARDRLGIKPLFYAAAGGRLYFGSEIKSLLCAPEIPRDIDLDALDHFLAFLYTPGDQSIFRAIHKLPPGHFLLWRGGVPQIRRYWELPADEAFDGTEAEAVERLHAVLSDAVRAHLISDVPIGAFLSGGLDSSVVVALASQHTTRLKTFSIGFDEAPFTELQHARVVASRYGTDHHELVVRPDAAAILDDLVWHFDEPFADASAIPTWHVSAMARQHATVVLSGDGGDELFGGYERYRGDSRVAAVDRYSSPEMRRMLALAADRLPHGARGRRFLRHLGKDERGRYINALSYFADDERDALLAPDVRRQRSAMSPESRLYARFDRYSALPWPSQIMRVDSTTYLPDDVLTKVDRMSMAHAIESRVPLLDNAVVDFAATLPASLKIRNGRQKHILKEVAADLLPKDIVDRPKQGFEVPIGEWFRGDLRSLFADTLLSSRSLQRGYFHAPFVQRLVREHLGGTRDHTYRLWQLVIFERWQRLYVDGQPAAEHLTPLAAIG